MHVHYLQHVPFESLGSIEPWLQQRGHSVSATRLYKNEDMPGLHTLDLLIVMGGPMGVHDESDYPWLKREKAYIKKVIDAGKTVIGICLGAQLIADVLGARIYKNIYHEIGWFDINLNPNLTLNPSLLKNIFPSKTEVFHWHGDTFDIPAGAVPIGSSEATANQGFIYDNRVIALQFHLETTPESAKALIENCRDELDGSKYVQSEAEIMADLSRFERINKIMSGLLQAVII
jgi:GMP synthase-like glutamine amidotransferase